MTHEDVISWLEYLSDDARSKADGFMPTNIEIACSIAIDALKAQEPRVMTFCEVKEHYNLPPVFVDDLDAQEDYYQDIQPLYFEFPNPCAWDVHWRNSDKVRTYLDEWEDRYNKTWRCWTSRPDEKRRAETPWN